MSELANQVQQLLAELDEVPELQQLNRKLQNELSNVETKFKSLEEESTQKLADLIEQLTRSTGLVQQLTERLEAAQVEIDQAHIRSLSTAASNSQEEDFRVLQGTVFEKVNEVATLDRDMRRLQAENERLRGSFTANLVLEERCRELEVQLALKRDVEQRMAKIEAENRILKERGGRPSIVSPVESPTSTIRSLMKQTLEMDQLQEQISSLKAEVKMKSVELEDVRQSQLTMKTELESAKEVSLQHEREAKQAAERLRLALLEIETLKSQSN